MEQGVVRVVMKILISERRNLLAEHGLDVLVLDFSPTAVQRVKARMKGRPLRAALLHKTTWLSLRPVTIPVFARIAAVFVSQMTRSHSRTTCCSTCAGSIVVVVSSSAAPLDP